MISPISVATDGFLNESTTLSVATYGFLQDAIIIIPDSILDVIKLSVTITKVMRGTLVH